MAGGFSFQIRRNYHPPNDAASDLGKFSHTQFLVVRTAPKHGYSLAERNDLLSRLIHSTDIVSRRIKFLTGMAQSRKILSQDCFALSRSNDEINLESLLRFVCSTSQRDRRAERKICLPEPP